MSATDRQRVGELFDHAVELAPAECEAWLAKLAADDPALHAEVARLLRADARASAFLERPLARAEPGAEPEMPRAFGPYRVLKRIGAGGMGEVWLAERDDGEFEQRVAIKQLAYPTPGLLQRFRQERQILARLEHPNIARLIDGGVADGAPYLAMEYVEGVPITDFVRERALDVPSTLRLFLRVCEGVQYAHQNLVVHRDLKPSNIFVTADGQPKLLDFGIAKVLTTTDMDARTQTVARMLTPDYAAPEQFSGGAMTTATDVYALGVVLYELLAGARPERRDGATTREPVPPSTAASRTTGARRRILRGDLDRIALTALAAEPVRRYPSAEALAADVRRYLDGRPIAARGDGVWYRFGKFARRNRYAIAAALLVFAVSIAATIVSLGQARRAREQAALAEQQARRAEAVRSFLVNVFAQASPDEAKGKPITAHELLDKSEPLIDRELRDEPALRADVRTILATLYMDIGDYGRAEALLEQTVAASSQADVPPDVRARTLISLASLENDKRQGEKAYRHASTALELARQAGRAGADEASDARHTMNMILVSGGDAKLAEPKIRETLASDIATFGEKHDAVAEDYSMLGTAYDELTRYEESEAAFAKALAISRELHGDVHNTVAKRLNDLGLMRLHKGDLDGAEAALAEASETATQLYGRDTDNAWTTRSNLIRVIELKGRFREALALRKEILAAEERLVADTRPDAIAFASNFIGVDHRELGEFAESEAMLRRALDLWVKIQGGNDKPSSATPLANLGLTLTLAGRYAEAGERLRAAYAIQQKHEAPGAQWVNLTRGMIGNLLRLQHRRDEAVAELRAAATAVERNGPNPWLAQLDAQLAEAELDAGHPDEARRASSAALAAARASLPAGNIRLGAPLFAMARVALATGDAAEAEKLAREALAIRTTLLPATDPRVLEIKVALANALAAQGRASEARAVEDEVRPALAALDSPYAIDLKERLATAGREKVAGGR